MGEEEVVEEEEEEEEAGHEKQATCSASCFNGYKSAMKDLYKQYDLFMPPEVDAKLQNLVDCYYKAVADKKRRGVMAAKEGKDPLSFSAYKKIAER
jgi:hypothetical protein